MRIITNRKMRKTFENELYYYLFCQSRVNGFLVQQAIDHLVLPTSENLEPVQVVDGFIHNFDDYVFRSGYFHGLLPYVVGFMPEEIEKNPYYRNIKLSVGNYGKFKAVLQSDEKNELFLYSSFAVDKSGLFERHYPCLGYWR